ncbi:MAG: class I SAM-dependent methyltransferase family protein [Candidatus Thermoplasmatota archaeon]|nr:class I SAM-dependent methyltransferase family protein [Candidatus Thermoplasmatota archaeon]
MHLKMRALCVKAPKQEAELVREKLLRLGVLIRNLKIKRDDFFVYIPVSEKVELGYELLELELEPVAKESRDYKELLKLPEELHDLLPKSFDIIGDICVIKLDNSLLSYKKEIGNALLKTLKNLRVVCTDSGVKEELRVRHLEIIAGENRTQALHTEHGIKLRLDLAKVYFSPRLASEHYRVAKQVKEGEIIIDMFAGVGGFSIMIAKHRKPEKIYAIDLNPYAIEYLKENIKLNKVSNILPLSGDAKELIKAKKTEKADRIIMDLPLGAFEFFDCALEALKDFGIIHYYDIIERGYISDRLSQLEAQCKKFNYRMEVGELRTIKSYSATEVHVGIDLKLQKCVK